MFIHSSNLFFFPRKSFITDYSWNRTSSVPVGLRGPLDYYCVTFKNNLIIMLPGATFQ